MTLLDLLFPKTCLGCGKPADSAMPDGRQAGQYFCSSCVSKIELIENQICPVCERPSPFGKTCSLCQTKLSLDGLISLFDYKDIIKKAIHELKFKFSTDLIEEFFKLIMKALENKNDRLILLNQFIKDQKPVIVPIPLHWYKENLRGFNQSEIFGRKLEKLWSLEFKKDLLIRSKFTPPQAGLTQDQRKENISKAFSAFPIIHNSLFNILLIDDIWTTGATLKTCGALLKKSGAKTIWGLTIAR